MPLHCGTVQGPPENPIVSSKLHVEAAKEPRSYTLLDAPLVLAVAYGSFRLNHRSRATHIEPKKIVRTPISRKMLETRI